MIQLEQKDLPPKNSIVERNGRYDQSFHLFEKNFI